MPFRPYIFISDIHGNIDALSAVLADTEPLDYRGIICLGDIIGYAAEPGKCVQRVMETCLATVKGNHEAMLFESRGSLVPFYGPAIGKPLDIARSQLTRAQATWLRSRPLHLGVAGMTVAHASLEAPDEFIYLSTEEDADGHFAAQKTALSFHGHTHIPGFWEKDGGKTTWYQANGTHQLKEGALYAINVGSVGQPRDDISDACYTLYNPATRELHYRRIPYEITMAQARILKAGIPSKNAERLDWGG